MTNGLGASDAAGGVGDVYILLLDLGIEFVQKMLSGIKSEGAGATAELLGAGQAFVDAMQKHKADVINKANLEAQRG